MKRNLSFFARSLAAWLSLLGVAGARPQTVEYEIRRLPFPPGQKLTACLNDAGVVAATVNGTDGPRAFVSGPAGSSALGIPEGVDPALVRKQFVAGINASGVIAGHHDLGTGSRPVVWEDRIPRELPMPNDGPFFLMGGINDAGQVSGSGWPFTQFSPGWTNENGWDQEPFFLTNRDPMRPLLWNADGELSPVPLPPSKGALDPAGVHSEGINEAGDLVCWQWNRERLNAWVWGPDRPLQRLPSLGYRQAHPEALNTSGLVVGSVRNVGTDERPFVWQDGRPIDLGFVSGYTKGTCVDVNEAGVVVGQLGWYTEGASSLFRWRDGEMVDLQERIRPGSGWDIRRAFAINDAGWILGSGTFEGVENELFVLIPYQSAR